MLISTDARSSDESGSSRFSFLADSAKVKYRLRLLGITRTNLHGCQTLEDLKLLAKKQYYHIAGYLHPDTEPRTRGKTPRQRPTGQTFQTATEAYDWVMGLTEGDIKRLEKKRKIKATRGEHGHFTGSLRWSSGVYDCPLPWHFDRKQDYGFGYQQSFDHIAYQ